MAGCALKLQRVTPPTSQQCNPMVVALLMVALLMALPSLGMAQAESKLPASATVPSVLIDEDSVRQSIERFHAELLASAQKDADFLSRESGVAAALDALFDFERIARISAGRIWRDLDAPARAQYVVLLRDLVSATYVSRFQTDRGQRFETLDVIEVKPQRFVVKTRITRPNNKAVTLEYYFRGGRVFNVVANGVSDLSVRRADYAAIIKGSGFAGLLADLRRQLAALRA